MILFCLFLSCCCYEGGGALERARCPPGEHRHALPSDATRWPPRSGLSARHTDVGLTAPIPIWELHMIRVHTCICACYLMR